MNEHKAVLDGEAWYDSMKVGDGENSSQSTTWLGPERGVFLQAMANIMAIMQGVFESGPVDDAVLKAKLAIANRGFDLLWSAWHEMLAGRYNSATEHWRSLYETPDFLKALQVWPLHRSETGEPRAILIGTQPMPNMARSQALYLAHDAVALLAACAFAFQDVAAASASWERTGHDAADEGLKVVKQVFEELGSGKSAESGVVQ